MRQRQINISIPNLSQDEIVILRRYLTESNHFSGAEWQALRLAMRHLKQAIVQFGQQKYTFHQFYRTFINGTYAYPFLNELKTLPDIEQDGLRAQAKVARQIWRWLTSNGIKAGEVAHAEYLIVFCLAQWGAFAREYIFEAAVIQNVQRDGIAVNPHDPVQERFSPYDLYIPGLGHGDIKTSRYFLDDLVAKTAKADFYISRIYASQSGQLQKLVFLTPPTWQRLEQASSQAPEIIVSSLAMAHHHFPKIVQLNFEPVTWILLEFQLWKKLVRQLQKERK